MEARRLVLPQTSRLNDPSFLFGVATASYQIEGAGDEDGRLPCIWDRFAEEGRTANGDSGAVACDHYHRWSEDLELIRTLNVDAYRLSIAWPRVMFEDETPNHKGIDFYKKLLDRMAELRLRSFVTLYHWDLPQWMEDRGGWVNRETAYRYADYAELMVRELGDRVEAWATFNEPHCSAYLGYANGVHAPGLADPRLGIQAGHHILVAHGLAMDVIRSQLPHAKAGIVLNVYPAYPASDDPRDVKAAELAQLGINDWFLSPLLNGHYPEELPRLFEGAEPAIIPGDMELIRKPLDYLGLNYYTRWVVRADEKGLPEHIHQAGAEMTDMQWEVYPDGFKDVLVRLNESYRLPPVYITENGMASDDRLIDGMINDEQRMRYLQSHLTALHEAIDAGVDIRGYFAWSLMDNFEWAEGYRKRFGLVYVDYETQERVKKASALMLENFLRERRSKQENTSF